MIPGDFGSRLHISCQSTNQGRHKFNEFVRVGKVSWTENAAEEPNPCGSQASKLPAWPSGMFVMCLVCIESLGKGSLAGARGSTAAWSDLETLAVWPPRWLFSMSDTSLKKPQTEEYPQLNPRKPQPVPYTQHHTCNSTLKAMNPNADTARLWNPFVF